MGTPPSANGDARPRTRGCPTVPLWDKVRADPADFNSWTALIGAAERTEDVHKIRAVYDAFLAEFPLCYGYWKKYADAEARLAGIDGVEHVYERATHAFPYSIDLWTQRASHAVSMRRDAEKVRELFESGLAYAGTDWLAHPLWDAYIHFEQHSGCGSPVDVSRLYGRVLRVPLKELDKYWAGFDAFATNRSPSAVIPPEELRAIDAAVGRRPRGVPTKGVPTKGVLRVVPRGLPRGVPKGSETARRRLPRRRLAPRRRRLRAATRGCFGSATFDSRRTGRLPR